MFLDRPWFARIIFYKYSQILVLVINGGRYVIPSFPPINPYSCGKPGLQCFFKSLPSSRQDILYRLWEFAWPWSVNIHGTQAVACSWLLAGCSRELVHQTPGYHILLPYTNTRVFEELYRGHHHLSI